MAKTTYKRLLETLDGSKLVEVALVDALVLAHATQAEVVLLEVLLPIVDVIEPGRHIITVDEQWEARRDDAMQYLNRLASAPEWRSIRVRPVVEMGPVAETIIEHARKLDVMTGPA